MIQRRHIGVGGILTELLAVDVEHLIGAVAGGLVHRGLHAAADDHSHQLAALLVGQFTAGIQQLDAHVLGGAVFLGFYKYPKVLGFRFHVVRLP